MWRRGQRGNCATCSALTPLSVTSPATHKQIRPSGADSQVGGFVYIVGPHGSLQWTVLWGWEFLLLSQHPQIFTARGFEALVSRTETLDCAVCLASEVFLPAYPHTNMGQLGQPGPPATALPAQSITLLHVLSTLTARLYPSCLSGWMSLL